MAPLTKLLHYMSLNTQVVVVWWTTWSWTGLAVFVMQGDLCAYMLQEYKERQDTARRSKQVSFTLPATVKVLGLGIPIVNIHPSHDGTVVTVREDGLVCHWSPELKPLRTKDMFVCFPPAYFTEYEKTKANKVLVCLSVLLPKFILASYNYTFLLSKKGFT